ncbi:molybdopterin molybdotransferase MoeA [Ramlibacter pallidus]|uniref:Molybdopterin molybdenumtransferase n=1 Tax=Ramlibacter pallidus TaxID=2780087 RepID=A0ABR9S6K1_9BURK|nr:molybdopterin molybdotransferase MoeA [Ramlibacter pallidus]
MNAARPPLRPLDDALAALLALAQPLGGTERVATFDADGRVLAEDLVSTLQVPPQDNSSMDGYAVRRGEIADEGVPLPVSQRIPAGAAALPLQPGTIARIFTGASVPEGADAIVMQEDTEALEDGRVRILRVPSEGQWIRRSGEDITRGSTVLARGTRLGPAAQGLAASIGRDQLQVARRPRVALFSTGDELVMPGQVAPEAMQPGAIYNSNRFFLRSLLRRLGCEVQDFGIVPDRREATVQALREAASGNDLILTSGGVSVGEEDHVKPAVQQLGSLDLWQIAMKPGKPFAHGRIGEAHFIGLPGNPVSSFVTFLLLVRPFLLQLQGAVELAPAAVPLPAHFDWPRADRRREFLRARRNAQGGLELFPNQSSGVLTSTVWADGLIDLPAGQTVKHGDVLRFLPLAELLA